MNQLDFCRTPITALAQLILIFTIYFVVTIGALAKSGIVGKYRFASGCIQFVIFRFVLNGQNNWVLYESPLPRLRRFDRIASDTTGINAALSWVRFITKKYSDACVFVVLLCISITCFLAIDCLQYFGHKPVSQL